MFDTLNLMNTCVVLKRTFAEVTKQQHKPENKPKQKTRYILSSAASLQGGDCMNTGKYTQGFVEISISSAQELHFLTTEVKKRKDMC